MQTNNTNNTKYYQRKDSYVRSNYMTYETYYNMLNALNINKLNGIEIKNILNSMKYQSVLKSTPHTDVRIIDEIMALKDKNIDYISGNNFDYVTKSSDIVSDKNKKKVDKIREKYPTEIRFSNKKKVVTPTTDYFQRIKPTLADLFSEKTYNVMIRLLDEGKLILAGGFLSGLVFATESRDIDLFLTEKTSVGDVIELIDTMVTKNTIIYTDEICVKVWSEKVQVDIVLIKYKKTHDLINSFDLSCSMFAYSKNQLYYNSYSMYTVNTGTIVANNKRFLSRSQVRLVKYLKRGFSFGIPINRDTLFSMGSVKMFYIDWNTPVLEESKEKTYIWYKYIRYYTTESIYSNDIDKYTNKVDFVSDYQLPILYFGSKLGKVTLTKYEELNLGICKPILTPEGASTDVYWGVVRPNKMANNSNYGIIAEGRQGYLAENAKLFEYLTGLNK